MAASKKPPTDKNLNAYGIKTQPELVSYYHAAGGVPTKPTWLAEIKTSHYASWMGLNYSSVAKHFPESEETWKGHGRKKKSGLRPTKQALTDELDGQVKPASMMKKEHCISTKTYDLYDNLEPKVYTDHTGRFLVQSYRGNQYIMVLIELDGNSILVEPMQNLISSKMVRAYQTLVDWLKACRIEPKMHIPDNECSNVFKKQIKTNNMDYQLVPPHDHRQNTAEKAVQTFKDHFLAVLFRRDAKFPMELWCQILRQARHQLNLL